MRFELRFGGFLVLVGLVLGASAGCTKATRAKSSLSARRNAPAAVGVGTGHLAVGWGGREAEILHVEGAVPGAPIRVSDKPRPQGDSYVPPLAYDLDEARALLAEAGWSDTDGDGILDKDGEPFEFELKLGSTRSFYRLIAAALQDSCEQVGIRMKTKTLRWSPFIEDYNEGVFDAMSMLVSLSDPWIDPFEDYHSSHDVLGGANGSGWHTAEADALLEAMTIEFDDEKRNAMFRKFNMIFRDEQPALLIAHGLVGVLQSNRFEGVEVFPTGLRNHAYWVEPENVRYRRPAP